MYPPHVPPPLSGNEHQISAGSRAGEAEGRMRIISLIWRGLACMLFLGGLNLFRIGTTTYEFVLAIVFTGLGGLAVADMLRRMVRHVVRLRRARQGRCTHCGYLFDGLHSARCPECGKREGLLD